MNKFKRGDHVRKIKGSEWEGTVVGEYYNPDLDHYGVCVLSNAHKGSIQIYPEAALELVEQEGV